MMPGGIIGLCLSKQSQLTCLTLAVTVYSTNTKAGLAPWAIGGLATSTVKGRVQNLFCKSMGL